MSKIALLAAFGAGYVLGSKAGRERYEQIRSTAQKVADNPRVQSATDSAREKAGDLATQAADVAREKVGDVATTAKHAAQDRLGSSSDSGSTGEPADPAGPEGAPEGPGGTNERPGSIS